ERVQREQVEALAYTTDMSLAQKLLETGNLGRVRLLLDRHRPSQASRISRLKSQMHADRRGWEWRYLWQHSRSDERSSLRQSQAQVLCLAFSPEGTFLASGDNHGVIRVWDLAKTQQPVASARSPITPDILQFCRDGHLLVSAGLQHGLRLWDWNPP